MRKVTTKRQEHTVAVMDGVGALSGAARGLAAGRRRMNAMDRVGAFSGAAYVLLANLGGALIGGAPTVRNRPGSGFWMSSRDSPRTRGRTWRSPW